MTEELTLEQVAAAREEWRAAVASAQAALDHARGPYEAARGRLGNAQRELARTELALATAKRAHFIAAAVRDTGIETDDPPVMLAQRWTGEALPRVYELVALSREGVGLYAWRPERSHRYEGKTHAIRAEHVPEALRAVATVDSYSERVAGLAAAGFGNGATCDIGPVHNTPELWMWQQRGRGDFGAGSGAMKPSAPPDRGRWRWLKVTEQHELEGG